MPNLLITSNQLTDQIDREHSQSGIDTANPATFTNAMVIPIKSALGRVNDQLVQYYNRGILELASSSDLDDIVAEYGISRSVPSVVYDDSRSNFYVSLKAGIAKDYSVDPASPLVIPANIITIKDVYGRSYTLGDDIIIYPDSSSCFCPIASTVATAAVGIGEINSITVAIDEIVNLDPTKTASIAFICNNNKVLAGQGTVVSDKDLRDRAILRVNSMNNTNEDAIRLVLLDMGITDVTFHRGMYGIGTIGILVKIGGTAQLSDTTVELLNNIVGNICPFARIVVPEFISTGMCLVIQFGNPSQVDATKTDIYNAIRQYFISLSPGNSLDPDQILRAVRSVANVMSAYMRCLILDDRKVLIKPQAALLDQLYVLATESPITYTEL